MTEKPSAIRTDKVFTLDSKLFTIESIKADGNGPYVYKGTSTKLLKMMLVKDDGSHPEFPGPSFWHFRKDRQAFRRFAAELVVEHPALLNLPRIGHDMDKAQMLGFRDIFTSSTSAWCTQHIKARDAEQLRVSGINKKDSSRILRIFMERKMKFSYRTD